PKEMTRPCSTITVSPSYRHVSRPAPAGPDRSTRSGLPSDARTWSVLKPDLIRAQEMSERSPSGHSGWRRISRATDAESAQLLEVGAARCWARPSRTTVATLAGGAVGRDAPDPPDCPPAACRSA